MKKINMNRLAAALLVLVLLTSCFVGSTMARYATGTSGEDTARAAKFGVTIEAYGNVFGQKYMNAANDNVQGEANLTVSSSDTEKVVAPGTKGDDVLTFKIGGSTEVAVKVTITLDNSDKLQMITLPAKEDYTDYTQYSMGTSADSKGSYGTFDQASDYNPIVWTLKKTGATDPVAKGTLEEINTYLGTLSVTYEAGSADFAAICGTYTLSWEWVIDAASPNPSNNPADTYIGMVAAGVQTDASVVLKETFAFKIYIEQVD